MYSHGLITLVFIIAIVVSLKRFLKRYYLEQEPTLNPHPIGAAFGFPFFLIGLYASVYGLLWALLPGELSQLRLDTDVAQRLTFDQVNSLFETRKWVGTELIVVLVLGVYCIFGLFRRGQISEKNIRNSANLIVWGILLLEVFNLYKTHSNLTEHGISGNEEFKYIRGQLISSTIAVALFFWELIRYVKAIELVYKYGKKLSIPLPLGSNTSGGKPSDTSSSLSEPSANAAKKKCPYCGEEIQVSAIKCRYCGEWLTEQEKPKELIRCSVCGEKVEKGLERCPMCHEPLHASDLPLDVEEKTKECMICGEEILEFAKKCRHCGEWQYEDKELIDCPVCGEKIEKGLETCPYCHEPLSGKPHINMMICPICGENIPADSKICPECNEPIEE